MTDPQQRRSAFNGQGFEATITALVDEVQTMYRADGIPWVVGYSGAPVDLVLARGAAARGADQAHLCH